MQLECFKEIKGGFKMLEFLMMLFVMLFGVNNKPKTDLRKKQSSKFNSFIQRNFFIIMLLCFICFIITCFAVVGASGVESGNYYYHLQDVI